ncbi:MAG: histidinol-phosphate transaminase [Desulfitobacteriaceae bacterium]|nr:histidinol-phosphate transaminase [Desulfitobacteriaceae bacterium]MDD4752627.1 histidinol-phosphate transaminase [Desulfitobacteriaceae bacterium]
MTKIRDCIMSIKPYTPGKPIEEVEREYGLAEVIKMASNESPLGPSPKAIEALREAAAKVHIYPDGRCYYLKQELEKYLDIEEKNIIVGNGSDEIIKLLAETYLNPGDEVIMANPSFSEYAFAAQLMGAKIVEVPVNEDYTHDLAAMAKAVTEKTKIVFICNPNNPTGTLVTKEEVGRFLKTVPDEVIVVLDEAYAEYVEDQNYPDSIEYVKNEENVVVLRTFSKIYGLAGLRAGYGIAREDIINLLNRVREPFNVNSMAQCAAIAGLKDKEHLEASFSLNSEGKRFLYDRFKEMGLSYVPTEANFIFVDLAADCREVFTAMLKKGVIVRTGDIFGYPTFIRVTIGTVDQNERFIATLKEVLDK